MASHKVLLTARVKAVKKSLSQKQKSEEKT